MTTPTTFRVSRVAMLAAAIAVLLASVSFVPPLVVDERPVGSSVPRIERWKKAEKRMMRKINRARARRDRRTLKWNKAVGYEARKHSRAMRASDSLFHSDLNQTLGDFSWTVAGETVGRGGNVKRIFRAFMKSKPHRRVLMNGKFRRMGAGIVRNRDGVKYVTVMLLNY